MGGSIGCSRSATAWSTTTSTRASATTSDSRGRFATWSKPRFPRASSDGTSGCSTWGAGRATSRARWPRRGSRSRDSTRTPRWSGRRRRSAGHVVFVNHTRQIGQWSTLREIGRRDGLSAALHCLLWVLPNSIFEAARERIGPHYWDEATFSAQVRRAGFAVLDMRRTFLGGASLLVWARKSAET